LSTKSCQKVSKIGFGKTKPREKICAIFNPCIRTQNGRFFIFAADGKKLTRARVTFYPSFASATDQGDQMSLRKNRPKCSPKHFLPKIVHNQYLGKK
jgi:hypothetical protein